MRITYHYIMASMYAKFGHLLADAICGFYRIHHRFYTKFYEHKKAFDEERSRHDNN